MAQYRSEVLNYYIFHTLNEVKDITDRWLQEYNEKRPYLSLGNLTPREY